MDAGSVEATGETETQIHPGAACAIPALGPNNRPQSGLWCRRDCTLSSAIHSSLHAGLEVAEVAGSWRRCGELTLRMTELASEVPPLDLFAETPRRPTLNYTISQLKWKQNGDSVRLNAKTLERRQPKSVWSVLNFAIECRGPWRWPKRLKHQAISLSLLQWRRAFSMLIDCSRSFDG